MKNAAADAITSEGGATSADSAAPATMAPAATPTPSRRCTRSRSTSATPIMVTPDGAIRPGATGMRQGPFGTHTVPACPINQFATGIVRQNKARNESPSLSRFRSIAASMITPPATSRRLPFGKAIRSQPAGRTGPAAIAPVVPARTVAEIAGVGVLDQHIDELIAADRMGEREGRRLVDPHQRRMDHEAPLHAEIERQLHGLDGVVAAIRIAGEVGLAHAGDQVAGAASIGERTGEGEEDQIAARHEG